MAELEEKKVDEQVEVLEEKKPKKTTKKKIKDKVSGEKHHAYGKHLSEEHKRKISLANKGKHSKPRKQ